MPLPIKLIGNGDSNIFEQVQQTPYDEITYAQRYFSNEKPSEDSIKMLELIDKHEDGIINAAVTAVSGVKEENYRTVPTSISDQSLLKLKTEGYIKGAGRSVTFTDKASKALKNKYLATENSLKSQRVKKKVI